MCIVPLIELGKQGVQLASKGMSTVSEPNGALLNGYCTFYSKAAPSQHLIISERRPLLQRVLPLATLLNIGGSAAVTSGCRVRGRQHGGSQIQQLGDRVFHVLVLFVCLWSGHGLRSLSHDSIC